jgi:YcaO-like protein with predicted kinase domain
MALRADDARSASSDYSDRTCPPEETLRRIGPLLADFGITRLSRLTTLDKLGIPVWNAVAPNAKSIVINQGKGITDIDARVSAAMEALERAVAGQRRVATIMASPRDLAKAGRTVETLDGLVGPDQKDVGVDDHVEWIAGINLLDDEEILVPSDAVFLDATARRSRFWQSSDGLASGNTVDEARLHAVLERIERDAYVLWQVASDDNRSRCCIDPFSLDDPVVSDLAKRVSGASLMLRLFDITSDIGIPCFSALMAPASALAAEHSLYLEVTHGSGAHPDPRRAAVRAITEAAQARLTFISGARDDIHPDAFQRPLSEETRRVLSSVPTRALSRDEPTGRGARALLAYTLDRLKTAGVAAAISVGLTDGTLPFAVVKMLIPQLESPEGHRKRQFGQRAIAGALA